MFTVDQLKAYIGPGGEIGTDEETVLAEIEERAVALVQTATGEFFGTTGTASYLLDGGGGVSIWLKHEVTAVTSVSVRPAVSAEWLELDSDAWSFGDPYTSRLLRVDGSEWPDGEALILVAANRGYATDTEPGEIRQLVLDLVNWQYRAGRKLALEDLGSPDVGRVKGWDRVINLYRGPLYG